MPHIILEHSANILRAPKPRTVFSDLHEAVRSLENIDVDHLKSRAVVHDEVYIGDGAPDRAFVHLQVQLLTGRDQSVRQRLAKECMRVLESHFSPTVTGHRCQLSVEVREMERSTYVKVMTAEH
jgi:5-carboxymethyl-2-hydroxymuconate isomerase